MVPFNKKADLSLPFQFVTISLVNMLNMEFEKYYVGNMKFLCTGQMLWFVGHLSYAFLLPVLMPRLQNQL